MEGNPADLTAYKDGSSGYQLRDHTYYGNGCSGTSGSITPCSTRIVETADDDPQKNGTLYHYQAATAGTGGSLSTNNTIVSDTFCPLGWQLPYSGTDGDYYDKSRSWRYLLTKYYIGFDTGTSVDAIKIKSYPFSYVYSGDYSWINGRLYSQGNNGYYWSSTINSSTFSYDFNTFPSAIKTTNMDYKNFGFTVRCDPRVSILILEHNWFILKI